MFLFILHAVSFLYHVFCGNIDIFCYRNVLVCVSIAKPLKMKYFANVTFCHTVAKSFTITLKIGRVYTMSKNESKPIKSFNANYQINVRLKLDYKEVLKSPIPCVQYVVNIFKTFF